MPPKKAAGRVAKAKPTKAATPARVCLPRAAKTDAAEKAAEPVPKFVEKPAKFRRKKPVEPDFNNLTARIKSPKELIKPLKKTLANKKAAAPQTTVVKDGGVKKAGRPRKTTEFHWEEAEVGPSPPPKGSPAWGSPPSLCGDPKSQKKAGRAKKTKEKKVWADPVPPAPPSPPQTWPMSPSGVVMDDSDEAPSKLEKAMMEARERFKAVYKADPDANGIIPLNKYVIYSKKDPRGKKKITKNTPKKIEKTTDAGTTTRRCGYERPTIPPSVLSSPLNKPFSQPSNLGLFSSKKGQADKHHCDEELFDDIADDEEWLRDERGNPVKPAGPFFYKTMEMTRDYDNGCLINPDFKDPIKKAEDINKLGNLTTKLGPRHPNVDKVFAKMCQWNDPDPPPTPDTVFIFPRDFKSPVCSAGSHQTNCSCGIKHSKDCTICTLGPEYQSTFIYPTPWAPYTREELVIMIDTSVSSVLLDCPNCNLVVQHGLPLPLPFKLKAECTCTYPQLQAKQYREKPVSKVGQKGKKVALGEVELEIAIRDKRELLKELVHTSAADAGTKKYRQSEGNDPPMYHFDLAFLDDDDDEEILVNGRWEINSAKLAAAKRKEIDELLKEGRKGLPRTGRHGCGQPPVAKMLDLREPLQSPDLPALNSPVSPRKRSARSPKKV